MKYDQHYILKLERDKMGHQRQARVNFLNPQGSNTARLGGILCSFILVFFCLNPIARSDWKLLTASTSNFSPLVKLPYSCKRVLSGKRGFMDFNNALASHLTPDSKTPYLAAVPNLAKHTHV